MARLQQWILDKRDIKAIREGRAFRDGVLPEKRPPEPKKRAPDPEPKRVEIEHVAVQGFVRGQRSEARLIEVVEHIAKNRVSWIRSVRKATIEEDAQKIDVVVTTDVGDLLLQVKSSRAGLKKFNQAKYPHIRCIIAHDGESLVDEVLEKLESLRAMKTPSSE